MQASFYGLALLTRARRVNSRLLPVVLGPENVHTAISHLHLSHELNKILDYGSQRSPDAYVPRIGTVLRFEVCYSVCDSSARRTQPAELLHDTGDELDSDTELPTVADMVAAGGRGS
ncbi:hypothetical protein V1523DRAFT_42887, partial [Lipomyces doorenjongii]